MKTLDIIVTADVDGAPVPGFQPYTRQVPVREVFEFTQQTSSSSYADILVNLVPSSDITVRVIILTTDVTVTLALLEDTFPTNTFSLNAGQLFMIVGSTVETGIASNPLVRVSVPSGTATLTGIVGIL